MTDFPRITQDPTVMGGKPCVRSRRATVGMIVARSARAAVWMTFLPTSLILRAMTPLRRLHSAAWAL